MIQSGVADSQIDRNGIRKNAYCYNLILLQIFYCLKRNMLLIGDRGGGVYLFIGILTHNLTLLSQYENELISSCVNKLIHE